MKVAMVGAGNGGCAVAADLSLKGHDVTLIKSSKSMHEDNFKHLEENGGKIKLREPDGEIFETKVNKTSRDLADISDAEVVIIYIQTGYHEQLIERLAPHLVDGQILIINPGYLSTAYVLKYAGDKDIAIVEATSSFIDCRIAEDEELGKINVGFRNMQNLLGVYPQAKQAEVEKKLESFEYNFKYYTTIEIALHNPNLIVHTVGAIMSIPRIEKTNGDYCMYWEVWTPSVWKILEKLDDEKMDVLEALGCERLPYVEACKIRNNPDDPRDAKEIFMWYANMPTRAKGPVKVDSRYISEDVPQGLVMLEALGQALDIPTPVCTALIEIAIAALGRDLRAEGRTLDKLGFDNIHKILDDYK